MLVAGEISGWRHARGVVLVQRGGKITHFAVRYAQKRLRAFNNFLSGQGKIGDKIVSYLQPWLFNAPTTASTIYGEASPQRY